MSDLESFQGDQTEYDVAETFRRIRLPGADHRDAMGFLTTLIAPWAQQAKQDFLLDFETALRMALHHGAPDAWPASLTIASALMLLPDNQLLRAEFLYRNVYPDSACVKAALHDQKWARTIIGNTAVEGYMTTVPHVRFLVDFASARDTDLVLQRLEKEQEAIRAACQLDMIAAPGLRYKTLCNLDNEGGLAVFARDNVTAITAMVQRLAPAMAQTDSRKVVSFRPRPR